MADVFGWIGASRRKRTLELIDADVQAWLSGWSGHLMAAVVEELADEDLLPGNVLRLGDIAVGTVMSLPVLGAGMVGIPDSANPLAAHLGEQALADLLTRLAGRRAEGRDVNGWDELPRTLRDARMGAVRVAIRLPHGVIVALLARPEVDRRVPVVRKPAAPALVSRTSAIAGVPASLTVELNLGEVTLGDAQALSPGDVLVTQVPLTRWADIFVDTSPALPVMRGRPGSAARRRAVAIELLEKQESET